MEPDGCTTGLIGGKCATVASANNSDGGGPGQVSGPAPLPPAPTVWLSPPDGSTNASEAPSISIRTVQPLDRSVLSQLAKDARVLKSPSNAVVETDAEIAEGSPANGIEPTIRLTTKQPLENGWYILEVGALHPPLQWPSRASFALKDGTAQSRFRIGSEPVVTSIWVCEKAGGRTLLQVNVSETIVVFEPVSEHLTVEAENRKLDCDLIVSGRETATLGAACDLAGVQSIKLTLKEAFASASSPSSPVQGSSAAFEFMPGELPTATTGCKEFKPE
jgi:hypothetical protein